MALIGAQSAVRTAINAVEDRELADRALKGFYSLLYPRLEILLRHHDWNYPWADSQWNWDRGSQQRKRIRRQVAESGITRGEWEELFRLYAAQNKSDGTLRDPAEYTQRYTPSQFNDERGCP